MDHVLQETAKSRQMANHIAYTTFAAHGGNNGIFPTGPQVCLHYTQDTKELDFLVDVVTIKILSSVQLNRTSTSVICKGKLLSLIKKRSSRCQ